MVGEYITTENTERRLRSEGYPRRDVGISLGPDGKLNIHNLPDCLLSDDASPHGQFDSGTGKWEISRDYAFWAVTFHIESFTPDSAYQKGALSIWNAAAVLHRKPPHGLAVAIAAGDRGELVFRRK